MRVHFFLCTSAVAENTKEKGNNQYSATEISLALRTHPAKQGGVLTEHLRIAPQPMRLRLNVRSVPYAVTDCRVRIIRTSAGAKEEPINSGNENEERVGGKDSCF